MHGNQAEPGTISITNGPFNIIHYTDQLNYNDHFNHNGYVGNVHYPNLNLHSICFIKPYRLEVDGGVAPPS